MRRQMAYMAGGQYRRAYEELHPAQQALFTPDQYEACNLRTAQPFELESLRITATYKETMTLTGTSESVQGVTVLAEIKAKHLSEGAVVTVYEIRVGDSWRFAIPNADRIVSGTC